MILLAIGISTHFLEQFPFRSFLNFTGKILILVLIYHVFSSLGDFILFFHPNMIDGTLNQLEIQIFGVSPVLWISQNIKSPVLTEWLQINYSFYFIFGTLVVFLYYFYKNENQTDFVYFSMAFGLILSYIGYIIFPAVGPRDFFDEPNLKFLLTVKYDEPLQGLFFTQPIRETLNQLEKIKTDAFPSGHTAITLLALRHFYLLNKKVFWFLLPIGLSIITATVFCRYHYVIDVLAGIVLFILILFIDRKIYHLYQKAVTAFENWRGRRL